MTRLALIASVFLFAVTGCADGPTATPVAYPAGFPVSGTITSGSDSAVRDGADFELWYEVSGLVAGDDYKAALAGETNLILSVHKRLDSSDRADIQCTVSGGAQCAFVAGDDVVFLLVTSDGTAPGSFDYSLSLWAVPDDVSWGCDPIFGTEDCGAGCDYLPGRGARSVPTVIPFLLLLIAAPWARRFRLRR